jgi:WD40 repeat protein
MSSDWRWIVAFGGSPGAREAIHMIDVNLGSDVGEFEGATQRVTALAFSSDNRLIASTSLDKTLRTWDVSSRAELSKASSPDSQVFALAFTPDTRTLAVGYEKRIDFFEVATLNRTGSLKVGSYVWAMAFSPNNQWLAVGCGDATTKLFRRVSP